MAEAGSRILSAPGSPAGEPPASDASAAPLRRLDWRFLLPMPPGGRPWDHVALAGGSGPLARRLVEVGFARRVTTGPVSNADPVDVLVVLNGEALPPAALAALRPGGFCLWEARLTLPRPRSPEAAVARAGLVPVTRYAVLPRHDAAKVYLPVDSPGAMGWVMETLLPPSTPLRRLLAALLGALGPRYLGPALRLYPARVLVAARPPVDDPRPGAAALADVRPDARTLILCDAGNRVVVLPFEPGAAEPDQVIKVPKLPVFNDRTENEQRRLLEIRTALPPDLREALPEPLGLLELGGVSVARERFVSGRSLQSSSAAWRAPLDRKLDDLGLAVRWLTAFHERAPVARLRWDAEQRDQWVERPLREFETRFGVRPAEERLFTYVQNLAEQLDGADFRLVWWHRDFNIWNTFRRGDRLSVIDWEGVRPGPPLCDLLHFTTHWYEAARGLRTEAERLRGFRDRFLTPTRGDRAADAVRSAVTGYMDRLGLDPRFLDVLHCFTWVELALRRAEQRRQQGEPGADDREGNRNFPFLEVLAEALPRAPATDSLPAVRHAAPRS